MPLKTSKRHRFHRSLWKSAQNCAEPEVLKFAHDLATELTSGDRVLLEGSLGAGKTTFARALLESLGVVQPPEGSPSFAIAHEYSAPVGTVVHLDLYRIKHESEIEQAGINAYYWERDATVVSEWTSLFPAFEGVVLADSRHRKWVVTLEVVDSLHRSVRIEEIKPTA